MSTRLLTPDMPKKQENTSVKLAVDVWKKAKIIAAANETSMADYLSELLRPLVSQDYPAALQKLLDAEKGGHDRPRKKP